MSELVLIFDRREMVVRKEAQTIRVDRPGCRPERFPIKMISKVIVIGSPMVSCAVWREMAKMNIAVIMLPARGCGNSAYLGAGLSTSVETRISQFQAYFDPDRTLRIARWLVSEKIKGQISVLSQMTANPSADDTIAQLEASLSEMKTANSRSSVMGREGASAAAYFGFWMKCIDPKWYFSGRNRRPPKDPVNSLLSLTYTIAQSQVAQVVHIKGLDPVVGFLHTAQPGRDSLVLDLIEPLRPMVDRFVLRLIDGNLVPGDFIINPQDGCRLTKNGRRKYFSTWAADPLSTRSPMGIQSLTEARIKNLVNFFSLTRNKSRIPGINPHRQTKKIPDKRRPVDNQ